MIVSLLPFQFVEDGRLVGKRRREPYSPSSLRSAADSIGATRPPGRCAGRSQRFDPRAVVPNRFAVVRRRFASSPGCSDCAGLPEHSRVEARLEFEFETISSMVAMRSGAICGSSWRANARMAGTNAVGNPSVCIAKYGEECSNSVLSAPPRSRLAKIAEPGDLPGRFLACVGALRRDPVAVGRFAFQKDSSKPLARVVKVTQRPGAVSCTSFLCRCANPSALSSASSEVRT